MQHTSASLLIQENADPDVRSDLERFFARLVPDGDRLFRHTCEGPDDMPAHVRSAITPVQLAIPFEGNNTRVGVTEEVEPRIPLKRGETGADYRIYVGFSLNPEELQYNLENR